MFSFVHPSNDRTKAGRPAGTYIQQLCEDTVCSPEDLPEAMNVRRMMMMLIKLNGSKYCYVLLTIQLNINKLVYKELNDLAVLFSVSWQNECQLSIWPIDVSLFEATPGQSVSVCNEGLIYIPQSSSFTQASPLDYLGSYLGHSLGVP